MNFINNDIEPEVQKMLDFVENIMGIELLQFQKQFLVEILKNKNYNQRVIYPRHSGYTADMALCHLWYELYKATQSEHAKITRPLVKGGMGT